MQATSYSKTDISSGSPTHDSLPLTSCTMWCKSYTRQLQRNSESSDRQLESSTGLHSDYSGPGPIHNRYLSETLNIARTQNLPRRSNILNQNLFWILVGGENPLTEKNLVDVVVIHILIHKQPLVSMEAAPFQIHKVPMFHSGNQDNLIQKIINSVRSLDK